MAQPSLNQIIRERLARRDFLRGLAATPGFLLLHSAGSAASRAGAGTAAPPLGFTPISNSDDDAFHVAEGYASQVLLRWGDPLFPEVPSFDFETQTAALQEKRFGFNCDFNGFMPLTPGSSERGLLCVNHEYSRREDMLPNADLTTGKLDEVAIELASMGMSIVEIARDEEGAWSVELDSSFNRRITGTTPMKLTGPAAGDPLLRTNADPEGRNVLGMLGNCAGGKTPWGTVLTGEENIQLYFMNAGGRKADGADMSEEEVAGAQRYGLRGGEGYPYWGQAVERFDLSKEPHEANRFGWVVEIDPYDPNCTPRKRTALGRFRHEGATSSLADDGRVVIYSGDDQAGEFVYKFVSSGCFDPNDRAGNLELLDSGTLCAARFETDGTGEWLPLVPQGELSGWSQARILIHTRLAASRLGATPMDRPEDIEASPLHGRVYLALTKNPGRKVGDDGANPRAANRAGHVLELTEHQGDPGATRFTWNPFLVCGHPGEDEGVAFAGARPSLEEAMACPDNLAFDRQGNLWVATDGQYGVLKSHDAVYAVPTIGPERGLARRFVTAPRYSELCGPEFTPDLETFFINVQHPGEGGGLQEPRSTWPDGGLPRPSVVAIRKIGGGRIGS